MQCLETQGYLDTAAAYACKSGCVKKKIFFEGLWCVTSKT